MVKTQKNKQKLPSKILVIDDDEGIIAAFKVVLEQAGFDVTTSMTADIVKKIKKNNLPDLILLDVLLSGADGRDVCRLLKKQGMTKDIPIIMVSAHPSAEKTIRIAGANDFLAKPFEIRDLLFKVDQQLAAK